MDLRLKEDQVHHAWWDKSKTSSDTKSEFRRSAKEIPTVSSSLRALEREKSSPTFFIRPALKADIGRASKILADGFFKDNTNFITYQLERLETYLSLEVGFPKPSTRHEVFVACAQSTGVVLGTAEVDARLERPGIPENGPYLCNVAVDLDHLRQGIATALVEKCESQVQEWIHQECQEAEQADQKMNDDTPARLYSSLHLKVRQSNEKAIQMYDKLGYQSILQETEKKTKGTVLVMQKQLERLKPFKKRLSARESVTG